MTLHHSDSTKYYIYFLFHCFFSTWYFIITFCFSIDVMFHYHSCCFNNITSTWCWFQYFNKLYFTIVVSISLCQHCVSLSSILVSVSVCQCDLTLKKFCFNFEFLFQYVNMVFRSPVLFIKHEFSLIFFYRYIMSILCFNIIVSLTIFQHCVSLLYYLIHYCCICFSTSTWYTHVLEPSSLRWYVFECSIILT